MSKYTMTKVQDNGCTFYAIYSEDEMKYFAGYDFMGSIDWVQSLNDAYWMSDDEAYQIMADLEDSDDEPEENPADKQYLLKTVCEDIKQASIKTGKQIADIYETDQIAGIYASMEVWDLDTMKRISLLDLVEPILENKRWMEQEYRDYCENEAYGDY